MTPRGDLLVEHSEQPGTFRQEQGPFRSYERMATIEAGEGDAVRYRERVEFSLDIPIWRPVFHPLMKRALRDIDRHRRPRWWWPTQILTQRSARLLGTLSVIAIVAGYLGVLIGQTLTFAAAEFGVDDIGQTRTLAAIRIGVIVSVVAIRRADRFGRRPLLLWFTGGALVFTLLGSLSTGIVSLGILQAIARGLTTGLLTLLTLAVTEEVPAEVRAVGISLMTMCAALGGGMVLWVLPVADLGPAAWRWTYLAPALFIPLLIWAGRRMPETRRFDVANTVTAPAVVDRRRFLLIAGSAFLAALFLSPASQLLNEYLNDELGWSASQISLFRLVIGTPAGLIVLVSGIAADRVGRKPIGTVGLGLGAAFSLVVFFTSGLALVVAGAIGFWLLAGTSPALRGYQTELFPTRSRARVGGWIDLISVTGSAVGLLAVGVLSESWGALGPALAVFLAGPLVVAALVWFVYPETSAIELEAFNPDDPELV